MWKRDEAVRPSSGQPAAAAPHSTAPPPTAPAPVTTGVAAARTERGMRTEKTVVNIGMSVVIKGELSGSEDLMVEGLVEGTIQLREHVLTVGPNGRIKAQVFAKSVIVLGEVTGNIAAGDKVDIHGSVEGDIISPRVTIAEGAHFRGSVDMQRKAAPSKAQVAKPQPAAQTAPGPQADAADQPDDQLIDA
jgi:cytoskeletal protein CcmA (bactofilin family)